jgi:hypothetical protein
MTVTLATETDAPARTLVVKTLAQLCAEVDARGPRRWLVRGVWPAGDYGVLGAEKKTGKSWMALDLAVSVASGTPWLGAFEVDDAGPVVVFAGEGGDGNIVRRLRAVAAARGLVADCLPIHVCTRAPHLSDPGHVVELQETVEAVRPSLVVLDPFYLAAGGANGADLYAMGALLERPQHVCGRVGAALLVVTHFNRSRDTRGAARFTGAGPAEWGRVLLAATQISRHTDSATKATTVLAELEVTGGEIPDTSVRVRRTVWAVDPEDLDSPLVYEVDTPAAEDNEGAPASDLPPAAMKLLAALEHQSGPVPSSALVDWIAERHGHGLKRETASRLLTKLGGLMLADSIDCGPGKPKLWFRTTPEGGVSNP